MKSQVNFLKLTIYIDGWCMKCLKFGKILKKIDVFNKIDVKNIRVEEDINIRKIKEMYSKKSNGKEYYGFDSLFEISKILILLWIFMPIILILKISGLGKLLYSELAIKRKIIPLNCDENCSFHS